MGNRDVFVAEIENPLDCIRYLRARLHAGDDLITAGLYCNWAVESLRGTV